MHAHAKLDRWVCGANRLHVNICMHAYKDGSFFCSGHIRKARQAKDHAEALPMRPGTPPLTCPFREIQVAGYAHLHTTLNKSRDEKLNRRRVGRTNDFGGRAGVMGPRRRTGKLNRGDRIKNGASTWARTRDLSVNSRALCQLSHGGHCMFCDAAPLDRCRGPARRRIKIEVLPGFEPGSLDSKSRVLTITP